MTELAPVIARIVLRYAGGALLGMAWLADDPDAVTIATAAIGIAMSAGAEAWMWAARRYGWAK